MNDQERTAIRLAHDAIAALLATRGRLPEWPSAPVPPEPMSCDAVHWRQKWLACRKYLRAANRGAQTNALVISSVMARHDAWRARCEIAEKEYLDAVATITQLRRQIATLEREKKNVCEKPSPY